MHYDWNSMHGGEPTWLHCFSVPITLKPKGFFGLSAATGGVSDFHDVISFQAFR
jgi:hypothetical protein